MTGIRKTFCVFLSLIFMGILAVFPAEIFRQGNVYRQLPLYSFLEKKVRKDRAGKDLETEELLARKNGEYLSSRIQEENRKKQEELLIAEEDNPEEDKVAEEKNRENGEKEEEENLEETGKNSKSAAESGNRAETGAPAEELPGDGKSETGAPAEELPGDGKSETGAPAEELPGDGKSETGKPTENLRGDAGTAETGDGEQAGNQERSQVGGSGSDSATASAPAGAAAHPVIDLSPESLQDYDYVMNQFFIVDSNTATDAQQIDAERFLQEDLSIKQDSSVPQILIYHSHSQETFSDSREGEMEDTIVGVGDYLVKILEETYGYQVLHITDAFDMMSGQLDRSKAYDYAREAVEPVLQEHPEIQVVIDLHRDGVPEERHLVTEINGKPTAQILFYNGLSYTVNQGNVDYLPNPYIEDNLAFSFQLEYQAAMFYPEFYRGIYLAGLRYNLHLKPRALLLEAGAQTNTVQEVKNAMEPFADILNRVLKGGDKTG